MRGKTCDRMIDFVCISPAAAKILFLILKGSNELKAEDGGFEKNSDSAITARENFQELKNILTLTHANLAVSRLASPFLLLRLETLLRKFSGTPSVARFLKWMRYSSTIRPRKLIFQSSSSILAAVALHGTVSSS